MRVTHPAAAFLGAGVLLTTIVLGSQQNAGAEGFGYSGLNDIQRAHVSGLLTEELGQKAARRSVAPTRPREGAGQQPGPHGCARERQGNVKVNQNCLSLTDADLQGRAQAQNETWVAADPNDPSHVVASYNDYRRGDGTCGVSYSLDRGRTWADTTTPNGFTRGAFAGKARHYWQASGDTSVAWDTKGNVYLSCQTFNRGAGVSENPDQSSGLYVFRSTGTNGASFNFPGRAVVEHADNAGVGDFLLDKQLMTVDNHRGSPFQDRVYVTWTTFAADGTAYIYEAHSSDYGESFSAPVLVSGDSATCGNTYGLPTPQGRCNQNQFSQPFTGADGALYVVWSNFNNEVSGSDNRNQVQLARSTDGGATFSAPVKVASYYDLPDCDTYQGAGTNPFRACVPEKGSSQNSRFRASNYPIGAVDPTRPGRVVVSVGSYINQHSNESRGCTPTGFAATGVNTFDGVKNGGCNNDIVLSESRDGGRSFTGATTDPRQLPTVNATRAQDRTDQFWQNLAFSAKGDLVAGYYDRSYGDDETTGYSDISVSQSRGTGSFTSRRVTSSSMPPPTQFGGTFYGDYAGVAVAGNKVVPVWSDTRAADEFLCPGVVPSVCGGSAPNAPYANDQDAYAAEVPLR